MRYFKHKSVLWVAQEIPSHHPETILVKSIYPRKQSGMMDNDRKFSLVRKLWEEIPEEEALFYLL